MKQKTLKVEELERDLFLKSEFISDNLKKLEEGRKAYDEIASIFDEMRIEYQEQMIQQMESMENERKTRLKKLSKFSMDVNVLEKILNWYDINNKFFLDLAELNNIVYKFEEKINNGLSYDFELNYLLNNLPKSFISHKLLSELMDHTKKKNFILTVINNCLIDIVFENVKYKFLEISVSYSFFKMIYFKALRETAMTPKSTNSLWGNLLAKLFSSLLIREQISRSGTSINDRISRAGYSMKYGDLDSALNELNYLDEDILYPAQDWLKSARQRLLGLSALKLIKSELLSRSIKMVDNEE